MQSQNGQSFEAIVEHYSDFVYNVTYRVLGNQEWAWEVIPGKPAASKVQLRAEVDGAFNR